MYRLAVRLAPGVRPKRLSAASKSIFATLLIDC
jgi:hypothetical protein